MWHKDWPHQVYVGQWPIFYGPVILPFIIVIEKLFLYIRNGTGQGYSWPLKTIWWINVVLGIMAQCDTKIDLIKYMWVSDLYFLVHWFYLFMPRHQKVAGYYVIPSEILSVHPSVPLSVRPSVSAHHHSCIGNSSYSFRPILLKLYRCFKDCLKICMLFFQNPEIIFYHFLRIFNLDIFRALILQICIWSMYLVSATPPTVFGESFWNFTVVLRMVWRYAYCFFRILKLFFITFFAFLT